MITSEGDPNKDREIYVYSTVLGVFISSQILDALGLSEEQRTTIKEELWNSGRASYQARVTSIKGGFAFRPLVRFFTIRHSVVAEKSEHAPNNNQVPDTDVAGQAAFIMSDIRSMITTTRGIVADSELDLDGVLEESENDSFAPSFEEGFGHDDYLTGLFITESDRAAVTAQVMHKWGSWGVRTEHYGAEFIDEDLVRHDRNEEFDSDQYLDEFAELDHDQRQDAIKELWEQGILFSAKDEETGEVYSSVGKEVAVHVPYAFGFDLGYSEAEDDAHFMEAMSDEERVAWEEGEDERLSLVLQIEHSLRQIMQSYGGQLTLITREAVDYNANVANRSTDGGTIICCRFPDEPSCSSATQAIVETWGAFDVEVTDIDSEDDSDDDSAEY